MSSHSVPLKHGWRLWRCAPLRGTGFASKNILNLAVRDTAAAADQLNEARAQLVISANDALAVLRASTSDDSIDRRAARKALAKLRKHKAPTNISDFPDGPVKDRLEQVSRSEHVVAMAVERYALSYECGRAEYSASLAEIASDARFEEALLWQNPEAARLVLPRLRDANRKVNRSLRKAQGLVANYYQRYCVKNDTIGFFGPVGWAALTEDDAISIRAGDTLLRSRSVYFEHWAIDSLAAHFSSIPGIREHLPPRLLPTVRIEGHVVHYGIAKTVQVPPVVADLLSRCDGQASAQAISEQFCTGESAQFEEPDEVYELLEELTEKGLLTWTMEIPSGGPDAALALTNILANLPESNASTGAQASFAALDSARASLEDSAGRPAEIGRKLQELDDCYEALVGTDATRNAGEMYAGRTLVYEDCLRNIDLSLGRSFVDKFGSALYLMSISARWFSHEIGEQYRTLANSIFSEFRTDETVSYIEFWKRLAPAFPESADEASEIALDARAKLASKWAAILNIDGNEGQPVQLESSTLLPLAEKLFAAPAPGWPSARHVSPDMMISAAGPEALVRGEFQGVLGEIHLGNSVPSTVRLQQHDSPMDIYEWNEEDLGESIVCPVQPTSMVTRADRVSWSNKDVSLELGTTRSWRPREQVLRAADLVVKRVDGRLQVHCRVSGRSFDILAFLDQYLTFVTTSNFSWTPDWDRVPRVSIDSLVIMREQWKFDLDGVEFLQLNEGAEQFLAARRWARACGLPRWVFFKVPHETKPVFLDFDSPVLVARARTLMSKATRVSISEMSPTFDELWLPDSAGDIYASEIRIVAVDPKRWSDREL